MYSVARSAVPCYASFRQDELGLNPTVFYGWQKQFFENGAAALQRKGKRSSPTPEARKIEKLETKLTQKNEVLAGRRKGDITAFGKPGNR